jgi:hypothetical protein
MNFLVSLNQREGTPVFNVAPMRNNPYLMKTQHGDEDLSWLLG